MRPLLNRSRCTGCVALDPTERQSMYIKYVAVVIAFVCSVSSPVSAQVVWSDEFDGDSDRYRIPGPMTSAAWASATASSSTTPPAGRIRTSRTAAWSLRPAARDYSGNEFTSARMLTQGRFAFKYGTLEARIKMPDTANGLWPAFWMLGNNFPGHRLAGLRRGRHRGDGLEGGHRRRACSRRQINCALHFSDAADDYANAVALDWMRRLT